LTVLDRIHDLLGPHPQISLGDLGLTAHGTNVAPVATACYIVVDMFATLDWSADDIPRQTAHPQPNRGRSAWPGDQIQEG
jgi:hypothetical protein